MKKQDIFRTVALIGLVGTIISALYYTSSEKNETPTAKYTFFTFLGMLVIGLVSILATEKP